MSKIECKQANYGLSSQRIFHFEKVRKREREGGRERKRLNVAATLKQLF